MIARIWRGATRAADFAGDEPERAVFFPEDDRLLVERDPVVRHYEADLRLG